jgi:YidC/Oxa1 family membrane protein insertase
MDFGVGFISNNIMLPILDFFYGIVPSYGLAIIALTLIVRFAVFPLSAGQIRGMRKTRIVQPLMKERQEEIQKRYANDPDRQKQEMTKMMQEFGNPFVTGCLPALLQMPIIFALFATLRGSPFSDVNYPVNVQILPREQIERVQPQPFATKPQNIYLSDGIHYPIAALLPGGDKLAVGEKVKVEFQTPDGKSFEKLVTEDSESHIQAKFSVTKGAERLKINEDGSIEALEPGEATIQGTIPGIAADKGFLFITALGRVGATNPDGTINWDILGMVICFGLSLYFSQQLTGSSSPSSSDPNAKQQQTVNQVTPIIFSGMFLFFPLPAGVLMYMLIANIFQTLQTFVLMKEPLPENLQKMVAEQEKAEKGRQSLPFEPKGSSKKKEKPSG